MKNKFSVKPVYKLEIEKLHEDLNEHEKNLEILKQEIKNLKESLNSNRVHNNDSN